MAPTTGIFTVDSDGTDPALVRIFVDEIASFPEWAVTSQQDGVTKQTNEGQPTEKAIADWRALDTRLPDVAVREYDVRYVVLYKSLPTRPDTYYWKPFKARPELYKVAFQNESVLIVAPRRF